MIISYRLSKYITSEMINNNLIPQKYKDAYEYSFEYLFDLIFYNTSIIIIGAFMKQPALSLLYAVFMTSLRTVAGGYHSNTRIKCGLLSYGLFFIMLLLVPFLSSNIKRTHSQFILFSIFIYFILSILIALISPVEHPNKPFKSYEKKHLQQATITLLILFFAIYVISAYFCKYKICILELFCAIIIYISQIAQLIANRRLTDESQHSHMR